MYSHFLLGNIQILDVRADKSVVEGFAGELRGESEVGHRLPQRGKGVPLHSGCLQLPEALLPSGLPGGRTAGQPPGLRSLEAVGPQTWTAPLTQLSSSPSTSA